MVQGYAFHEAFHVLVMHKIACHLLDAMLFCTGLHVTFHVCCALQAQKPLPESQAGSLSQVPEARHMPQGIRPGVKPGMYPAFRDPVPQGSAPPQPGPSAAAQLGTATSPDSDMARVSTFLLQLPQQLHR